MLRISLVQFCRGDLVHLTRNIACYLLLLVIVESDITIGSRTKLTVAAASAPRADTRSVCVIHTAFDQTSVDRASRGLSVIVFI